MPVPERNFPPGMQGVDLFAGSRLDFSASFCAVVPEAMANGMSLLRGARARSWGWLSGAGAFFARLGHHFLSIAGRRPVPAHRRAPVGCRLDVAPIHLEAGWGPKAGPQAATAVRRRYVRTRTSPAAEMGRTGAARRVHRHPVAGAGEGAHIRPARHHIIQHMAEYGKTHHEPSQCILLLQPDSVTVRRLVRGVA